MLEAVLEALIQLKDGSETPTVASPQGSGEESTLPGEGSEQRSLAAVRAAKERALAGEAQVNFGTEDSRDRFVSEWAEHLEAIKCSPADVMRYLRQSNQTLASLYLVATKPGTPSPTEMLQFALRYALDARKPVNCHSNRYVVAEKYTHPSIFSMFSSSPQKCNAMLIELEELGTRGRSLVGLVRNSTAYQILGCVIHEPP
jgi:hypothetical protein